MSVFFYFRQSRVLVEKEGRGRKKEIKWMEKVFAWSGSLTDAIQTQIDHLELKLKLEREETRESASIAPLFEKLKQFTF